MVNDVSSIASSITTGKRLLLVVHEYLPLPLALWMNSLASLLQKQDKDVTILVAQEPLGWSQRIDGVYPVDMVVSLDQLRQIVTIPVSHQGNEIGDVSYQVKEGNLEITVVPIKETLDTDNIQARTEGKIYDVVVGIGISARHPLMKVLQANQASLSLAKGVFVGTYAVRGALQEALPFLNSIETVEKGGDIFLRKVLEMLTTGQTLDSAQRELVMLFIQSIGVSQQQFEFIDREGYEYLAKISEGDVDSGRMSQLYRGDFAKQNRILQQILHGAQQSENGELLLFTVRVLQLSQLNATVQDVITALYYLPKYPQVKQVVVVIEENRQQHHVYVNGTEEKVQQVAMKFGFSKTQRLTGGIVHGFGFEKVCQDVTRLLGHEVILSQQEVQPIMPMQEVVSQVVPQKVQMASLDVQESPAIPKGEDVPSLDEVLSNTVLPPEEGEEAELDSGESWDSSPVVNLAPQEAVVYQEPPKQSSDFVPLSEAVAQVAQETIKPPKSVEEPVVRTSSGVDFAAIAKKMRESIT